MARVKINSAINSQPGGYPLAPQFALQAGAFTGHLVRSFFENLLPEGTALEDVLAALALRDASTLELLGRLGQELPGVLSLLPEDAQHLIAAARASRVLR